MLDYGCGRGHLSLRLLAAGGDPVIGVDISETYVNECRRRAEDEGYSPDRFDFRVGDVHALGLPDSSVDLVVGLGILHHLDPDLALAEIHRVLRIGGRVLLQEPLADNPLLKLFRRLTPDARTEDEAPFTGQDLSRLTGIDGWRPALSYCGLLEAPVAMLTSVVLPEKPDNRLMRFVDRIENQAHRNDVLSSWNQYVLINLVKA